MDTFQLQSDIIYAITNYHYATARVKPEQNVVGAIFPEILIL